MSRIPFLTSDRLSTASDLTVPQTLSPASCFDQARSTIDKDSTNFLLGYYSVQHQFKQGQLEDVPLIVQAP
jgi:hypothetical protein